MTGRQFVLLLAVLVVLGAGGTWMYLSEREAWQRTDTRLGQKVFPELKVSEVAHIAIRDGTGQLNIVRGDKAWMVRERADFPADIEKVADLLLKTAELKVVQAEKLPDSQRARLQLVEPGAKDAKDAGTVLELKDAKGGVLARLLLGKKIMKQGEAPAPGRPAEPVATGRYVVTEKDKSAMLAVSEPFNSAEPDAKAWLFKDLVRAERIRTMTSTGRDGKPRWTVSRENESLDWKLAGAAPAEKPDLQKITDISSALGWVNLVDVVADPAKADTGLDKPVTVKAVTLDNLEYTVRVGNKADGNNYYVALQMKGDPPPPPAKEDKPAEKAAPAKDDKAATQDEKAAAKDGKAAAQDDKAPAKDGKAAAQDDKAPAKDDKAAAQDDKAAKAKEEKEKQDKAEAERQQKFVERIQREKQLDRWTYLVSATTVEPLLRDRQGLVAQKKDEKGKDAKKP